MWRLSEKEEAKRSREACEGFAGFIHKMNETLENARRRIDFEKEDWDEFDYENLLRESDTRADKYLELLDKYGAGDESEDVIAREMGWTGKDSGEQNGNLTEDPFEIEAPGWVDSNEDVGEVPDLEPDPATEGRDWIRAENGDIRHPLHHKCHEGAMALRHEIRL